MVHSMALDRGGLPRVAWLVLVFASCKPSVFPPAPPPEPTPNAKLKPLHGSTNGGRQVVVGEMCPQAAAGRPAVAPLIMHAVQWTDNASDISAVVERGSTPRFTVFGVDGKMAGVFDTVGLAEIGIAQPVASGAYTGASPCSSEIEKGQRQDDPKCAAATSSCGLAVAEIAHPDDPAETPSFKTGAACVSSDVLAVDIDGDGRPESFPIAQVLDGIRGPAAEWAAAPVAATKCVPKFALFDIPLTPEAEPGRAPDPKQLVTLDVLGVVDLDGDGRKELVLALRFATVRSIVIYSSVGGSAERLELVGEAPSLAR
jgi:hypothetical protein